jgi:hypothetical protein
VQEMGKGCWTAYTYAMDQDGSCCPIETPQLPVTYRALGCWLWLSGQPLSFSSLLDTLLGEPHLRSRCLTAAYGWGWKRDASSVLNGQA